MESSFDRDTAVRRQEGPQSPGHFTAEVSPDWRAGRGPHGGYLAAMLLRALTETVADPARAPRSLTIHFTRPPKPGPVLINTVIERAGRSLSTLSARMEQDGSLVAIALAAFSTPWTAPEIAELPMPILAPPDPLRETPEPVRQAMLGTFLSHLVLQPRLGTPPFTGSDAPMEIGAWLGTAEQRPIDALALAFFSDALFPTAFIRLSEPAVSPTVDLTIHFRCSMPRTPDPDPAELCFARASTHALHDGFFVEDSLIWAADGALLAQSRQLAIVMPVSRAS
jgi:acyl-CoA thioesterase